MKTVVTRGGQEQGVLPLPDKQLLEALATAQFVRRLKRPAGPRRPREAKPDLSGINLDLPLFDLSQLHSDASWEVVPAERVHPANWQLVDDHVLTNAASFADTVPGCFGGVTLEVFCKLHAGILYRQLELLMWAKDASGEIRREILAWMFDGPLKQLRNGRAVSAIHIPFSFDLCCYVEEIEPGALREAILDRLDAIRNSPDQRVRASLH